MRFIILGGIELGQSNRQNMRYLEIIGPPNDASFSQSLLAKEDQDASERELAS